MFTMKQVVQLTGVTSRTLRYYDTIDLLKPAALSDAGYRLYSQKEIDRLQHILFLKELEFDLPRIKEWLDDPKFDEIQALQHHAQHLHHQKQHLEKLLDTVHQTIQEKQGGRQMTNEEKFQAFKQDVIDENEKQYGKEIREKYGDETIDQSNEKLRSSTKEQFDQTEQLANEIIEKLKQAIKTNDPASEEAQQVAALHKQWLLASWPSYSKAAHRGVADMYVADERFTHYYDQHIEGAAQFLRDAIHIFAKE